MSNRERYAGIGVVAVLGLLGLDYFFVSPSLARMRALDQEIATEQQQLAKADSLFRNSRRLNKQWTEMVNGGLQLNTSEIESQLLKSIEDWAGDARLPLSSTKPERTEKVKEFQKITYKVSANGGMAQISKFVYNIQTARIPVHVTELAIAARKDGTDDLSLSIGIATANLAPDPAAPKPAQAQATPNRETP